ncbi:MAG TPA: hypothetical protein VGW40_00555 [Allosphingosinicella sp.]|nr:hypothetical protein [Allosphingosinicella sp.]
MNGDYDPVETYPPRRTWLRPLILPGVAFLLGLGAMGYILGHWDAGARALGIAPPPTPAPVVLPALAPALAAQPQAAAPPAPAGEEPERILIDPEVGRRVAALEQRIAQLDSQSRTAVGNADRAEGLLVAFAARRALDRGVQLGFLEALLRERFGASQPRAVGNILSAAREPVTLQELQLGLQAAGPRLIGTPPDAGWWSAFKAEMGSLITVRRRDTPSPEPTERLRRATQRLEAGQVDVALAEVMRIPGRDTAADWIRKARRYVIAREALDTIETAALLEPRAAPPAPAPVPARPAAARPQPPRPAPAQPPSRPARRR